MVFQPRSFKCETSQIGVILFLRHDELAMVHPDGVGSDVEAEFASAAMAAPPLLARDRVDALVDQLRHQMMHVVFGAGDHDGSFENPVTIPDRDSVTVE